jgi:dTDP-4-dehydrorhamnose reductase
VKVLVTGGRGLVGRPLSAELAAHPGADVLPLGHGELDVTDADAVRRAVDAFRPDAVVHLAAWTDVDGCERDPAKADRVNAGGTRNVAEACRASGAALLHVSTDYVFDGSKTTPWTESDPVGPLSAYGRSKLAAEDAVRSLAPRWTIARCQSIYGAGKKSFVDAILERAGRGEPLRVVTDQRVAPTWAQDLAGGLARLLRSRAEGLFLVANEGSCTWFECASEALRLRGLGDVPVEPILAATLARPAPRPANSAFDCSAFARAAGGPLPHWKDALARYLAGPRAGKETP